METIEEFFEELQKLPVNEQLKVMIEECKHPARNTEIGASPCYNEWLIGLIHNHGIEYISEKVREISPPPKR